MVEERGAKYGCSDGENTGTMYLLEERVIEYMEALNFKFISFILCSFASSSVGSSSRAGREVRERDKSSRT